MPTEIKSYVPPDAAEVKLTPNEVLYLRISNLEGQAFVDEAAKVLGSSYGTIAENCDYSKAGILEAVRKELKVASPEERAWLERFGKDARFRLNNLPDVDPDDALRNPHVTT